MTGERSALRGAPVRAAVFVGGTGLTWLAIAALAAYRPVDLTAVLLVLLAVVMVLAALTGWLLGILYSLVCVVLVNWYLVPPYGTFEVSSPENVVALLVFPLVAVVSAGLMELAARARARAGRSAAEVELVARVSRDTDGSLEQVRRALALASLDLVHGEGDSAVVVATTGPADEPSPVVVDSAGPGGYRLVGRGEPRLAQDRAFVSSLAAVAVRSYESGRMVEEARRAEQLAQVDQARTALLASVGHDLRTPLAGLRLAVDALRADDVELDVTERRELLDTVDASTSRLDELISNLLDVSRLEAGSLVAQPEPTALDGVVAAAVVGRAAGAVDVDVPDSLPLVLVDGVLLERVVENLVSNALRHGGADVGAPALVVATPRADAVVLEVVDHGAGLTTGPRADDGGTGLGLDIVRGFCDAMDVRVDLRETRGGGLTARLTLPLAKGGRR